MHPVPPTALAACCGFDLCCKYIWYLVFGICSTPKKLSGASRYHFFIVEHSHAIDRYERQRCVSARGDSCIPRRMSAAQRSGLLRSRSRLGDRTPRDASQQRWWQPRRLRRPAARAQRRLAHSLQLPLVRVTRPLPHGRAHVAHALRRRGRVRRRRVARLVVIAPARHAAHAPRRVQPARAAHARASPTSSQHSLQTPQSSSGSSTTPDVTTTHNWPRSRAHQSAYRGGGTRGPHCGGARAITPSMNQRTCCS